LTATKHRLQLATEEHQSVEEELVIEDSSKAVPVWSGDGAAVDPTITKGKQVLREGVEREEEVGASAMWRRRRQRVDKGRGRRSSCATPTRSKFCGYCGFVGC
jgi:hypothetical protein